MIGSQLDSYEITAMLGKGGMGEVYRASNATSPSRFCPTSLRVIPRV
jgi:hypothetical protein